MDKDRLRSRIGVLAILLILSAFPTSLKAVGSQVRGQPSPVMGLIELYGITSAAIVYGDEDEYAAGILQEALQPALKVIKLIPSKGEKPRNDSLVIYVGSFVSNPVARRAFKSYGYSVPWDVLIEGSYVLKTFRKSGRTTVFACGKDRIGTLYAVNDLKNYYLHFEEGRLLLNELSLAERAHLKYRWFCNRATREDWGAAPLLTSAGTVPASEPVTAPASESARSFLTRMRRLVEFMFENRLNGLVLGGLFQTVQGGESTAVEICQFARERGVRILPIVGMGGGRGFVEEAGHRFNLETWSQAHSELRAVDAQGQYRDNTLCLEKKANRDWYREGFRWLYENFKLGGVHLDTSDLFVCYCEDCKKARAIQGGHDSDYFKDLSRIVIFSINELRQLDSSYWISFATHTGFDYDSIQQSVSRSWIIDGTPLKSETLNLAYPPALASQIPESALCQWSISKMIGSRTWPSPFKAPAKHNTGHLDWKTTTLEAQGQVLFNRIQEITQQAYSSNLEGLSFSADVAPTSPFVELNYVVFAEHAFNPGTDNAVFFKNRISRLYGGAEAAKILLQILAMVEDTDGMVTSNRNQALDLAKRGLEVSNPTGKERWTRFVASLERWKP